MKLALGSTALDSGHLVPCHKANYLQKLGLELSPPGCKEGRAANRSPLQLLTSAVYDGDALALEAYAHYCTGMKGAHMLTWSSGQYRRLSLAPDRVIFRRACRAPPAHPPPR